MSNATDRERVKSSAVTIAVRCPVRPASTGISSPRANVELEPFIAAAHMVLAGLPPRIGSDIDRALEEEDSFDISQRRPVEVTFQSSVRTSRSTRTRPAGAMAGKTAPAAELALLSPVAHVRDNRAEFLVLTPGYAGSLVTPMLG